MKINWHSNAPWSSTGYANQTRLFTPRIRDLGYDMSITAFYGLQGGMAEWRGIRVLPSGKHPYGQDIIGASARFDGADCIISLMDVWVMQPENNAGLPWFPWFPVDCEPAPRMVVDKARRATKGIAMSKFGQAQAQAVGLDTFYVPHGVEADVFKPLDGSRERLGWPQDKFIVGMVAANKGVPPRKSFFEQIAAFKALHIKHPDTLLYLHTDDGTHGGECVDLVDYCQVMGLKVAWQTNRPVESDVDVLFADQYTYLLGLPDPYMVDAYNSLDVMMLCSMGEGFGIPLIEAQACGCPVITGGWTSMNELCFSGWKIPKSEARPVYHPHFKAWQWSVHPEAVAERLFAAYEMKGNADYRSRARDGALAYDADKVTEKYWRPALKEMEEIVQSQSTSAFEQAVAA